MRDIEKLECEESLIEFIKQAWHVVEPEQPYDDGWHLEALAAHLESITNGVEIDGKPFNRFLANVPPGTTKSLTVGVFWPAWEWGPKNMPSMRYVCASHAQSLSIRDNVRMRRLVVSEWYQQRWGDRVKISSDQNTKIKIENTATGFREAVAAGSITGSRGDRVIIDDPHSVEGAASDDMRQSTIDWFLEAVPTRMNNPIKSAIVVIMQRLHEGDVSGVILDKELGYEHLMLPMEFEPDRKCSTGIGFEDPRTYLGELLFPKRFPREIVERDKKSLGLFGSAGQLQQRPEPRGGGIIKRHYWQLWDDEVAQENGVAPGCYPAFDYILASLDTAYTEEEENDPSAIVLFGVWTDRLGGVRIMLVYAWAEKLEFSDLVTKTADTCRKWKVDKLLVESKAAGLSVVQELRRLYKREKWSIQTIDPGRMSKTARAYAVQPVFENKLVYSPDKIWADIVMSQCNTFPKGKNDDLVDCVTQGLSYLRLIGMAVSPDEMLAEDMDRGQNYKKDSPLYPGT